MIRFGEIIGMILLILFLWGLALLVNYKLDKRDLRGATGIVISKPECRQEYYLPYLSLSKCSLSIVDYNRQIVHMVEVSQEEYVFYQIGDTIFYAP